MSSKNHEEDQILKDLFYRSATVPDEALNERILEKVSINRKVFEYRPVISKKGWAAILSGLTLMIIILVVYDSALDMSPLKEQWFTILTNWTLPGGIFDMNFQLSLPELTHPFLMACSALIVFGIYFMISLKFLKRSDQ